MPIDSTSLFDPWIKIPRRFSYDQLCRTVSLLPFYQQLAHIQYFGGRIDDQLRAIHRQFRKIWLIWIGMALGVLVIFYGLAHIHAAWLTQSVVGWPLIFLAMLAISLRWQQRQILLPYLVMHRACERWIAEHPEDIWASYPPPRFD